MKKALTITLFSAAALTLFAAPASAETNNKVQETEVGISFKDNGTDIGEGPFKDNLAIVFKPGAFQFGQQATVGSLATYSNTVTEEQYLVINDDRPDTKTVWEVTAQMSALKNKAGDKDLASKLTFNLDAAKAYRIADTDASLVNNDYVPNRPEKAGVLTDLDPSAGITLGDGTSSAVELVAGGDPAVIMAKKGTNEFKNGVATLVKDTKLVVTDSKKIDAAGNTFTGKVTWTLNDALSK
jgi:hypothetical protein